MRQVNEGNGALETLCVVVRCRDRDRGLTNTAWTSNGEKPSFLQFSADDRNRIIPAYNGVHSPRLFFEPVRSAAGLGHGEGVVEAEEHEGRSEEHKQQFHPVVGSQPSPSKQLGMCFEMFLDITDRKSMSPNAVDRARIMRTSTDRVSLADCGKSPRKSYNCDLEIVTPRCQGPCQDRIPGVGWIENPRPLLFGGNVTLDHLHSAIEIIHQCPDC